MNKYEAFILLYPYPGSSVAVKRGCTCDPINNHHGLGMPGKYHPEWYVQHSCPLHGKYTKDEEEKNINKP